MVAKLLTGVAQSAAAIGSTFVFALLFMFIFDSHCSDSYMRSRVQIGLVGIGLLLFSIVVKMGVFN